MALTGTLINQFSTGYRVLIEWEATQNISANTSTITARFYLQSMGSGYPIQSSSKKTVRIVIDGTTYTSADNTAQLAGGQKKLMATATKTVTHNADGTKSITISGSIDLNATLSGTYYGTVNIPQQSFTLDTIPRASSISLSASSVNFGKSLTINISRASSSFTHTLRYNVEGQTGTIVSKTSNTSYSWTVPTSLISALTNKKNATCTIYCDTYSGNDLIGTKSATVTLNIPASSANLSASSIDYGQSVTITISRAHTKLKHKLRYNWNGNSGDITSSASVDTSYSWTVPLNFMNYIPNSTSTSGTIYIDTYNGTALVGTTTVTLTTKVPSDVVPSFSSISHSEKNSAVAALNLGSGVYVQNLSQIQITINNPQGAYGSTIKSYKIEVDGKTYTTQTATTNTITGKGTLKIIATITDSRGRTATKEVNITVLEYNPPKIDTLSVKRCNQDGSLNDLGTYIRVNYKGSNIYNLNSKNQITVYIDTKERSSSNWVTKGSFTVTQGFEGYKVLGSTSDQFDVTKSYDVRFRIVDKFYIVKSELSVSTGIATLSLGKTGIGVGKVLECGALDVGGDIYSSGAINAEEGIFSNNIQARKINITNGITVNDIEIITSQSTIAVRDTRDEETPTTFGYRGVLFEFKRNTTNGLFDGGYYNGTMTFQPWDNSSGGSIHQLGFTTNGNVWHRSTPVGSTWGAWTKLLKSKGPTDGQVALSLQNGWTGDAYVFKTELGLIGLRGRVYAGALSNGTIIAILPAGYRASNIMPVPAFNSTKAAFLMGLYIRTSDGALLYRNAGTLNSISENDEIHFNLAFVGG